MSEKASYIKQKLDSGDIALVTGFIGNESAEPEFEDEVQILEGVFVKKQKQQQVAIPLLATVGMQPGHDFVIQSMNANMSVAILQFIADRFASKTPVHIPELGAIRLQENNPFEVYLIRCDSGLLEMFPDVAEYWKMNESEAPDYWQIILPDEKGRWPWSADGCDSMSLLAQPMLGPLSEEQNACVKANLQKTMEIMRNADAHIETMKNNLQLIQDQTADTIPAPPPYEAT